MLLFNKMFCTYRIKYTVEIQMNCILTYIFYINIHLLIYSVSIIILIIINCNYYNLVLLTLAVSSGYYNVLPHCWFTQKLSWPKCVNSSFLNVYITKPSGFSFSHILRMLIYFFLINISNWLSVLGDPQQMGPA